MRLRSNAGINRREFLKTTALAGGAGVVMGATAASGRGLSIIRAPGDSVAAAAPAEWAVLELQRALAGHGVAVQLHSRLDQAAAGSLCIVASGATAGEAPQLLKKASVRPPTAPKSLALVAGNAAGRPVLLACGADARGLVYAVLELADRVNYADDPFQALGVPAAVSERPANLVRVEQT